MTLSRLDKTALILIVILSALTGLLLLSGNPLGLQAILLDSRPGVWGPLTVEFSAPVRAEAVQIAIGIQPPVPGVWENESSTRLRFRPAIPFEAGQTYRVVIQPGELGQNGERSRVEQRLDFNARPPAILYMPNEEGGREIWRINQDGSDNRQLTQSNGSIFDFQANRDGLRIAFSMRNEQGGFSLWQIGRDGQNLSLLLDCGPDRCSNPSWSPDASVLAYTREALGITGGLGAPRVWLLDFAANQTRQVYADTQIIGYGPSWSPDGSRLAMYDSLNNAVRVLELANGEETFLASVSGHYGGWSPDGRQMFYVDIENTEFGPRTAIKLADFATGEYTTFMGGKAYDSFYNVPAWAPDGKYIALGLRPEDGSTASSIWIVTLAMLGGPMIPGQPDSTDGFYSWDSSGTKLLFQRTPLKGQYQPDILLYDMNIGEIYTVVKNASWPQWIP
jgi:Tol biopolymer transport system component